MRPSPLVTRKFCKFGYSRPLWVWVIVELVVLWSLIGLPHMGHVNSKFVLECPSYLLPNYFNGGRWKSTEPLVHMCVCAGVSLCCSLAHGFGLCGVLMSALGTPYYTLGLSGLLGAEKGLYLCVGGIIPRP